MTSHPLKIMRLACAAALALCAQVAIAQAQVKLYKAGQGPSAQEVATILANGLKAKTRGIKLADDHGAPASTLRVEDAQEANVLAMAIQFEFDSARLTRESIEQLSTVAEGIKLLEGGVQVLVEGHTDAKGSLTYNQRLSLRRAQSVRNYLVQHTGLDVRLFKVRGKGPSELLTPEQPFAPENRRVQFIAG
jgi:outer membrane protein OmpA-like peptidoglycan-associated protein